MLPVVKLAPMVGFSYRHATLYCEGVAVPDAAKALGTPLYLYSKAAVIAAYREIRDAFAAAAPLVCYSVKANSNLHLLRLLAAEGAGCDVVSGGELFRALRAGVSPQKIVYAGVGKTEEEIRYALESGVFCLNVESEGELSAIARLARARRVRARVALRLNPDVDAHTHAHITTGKRENKFGLDAETVRRLIRAHVRDVGLEFIGLHTHIGSQITAPEVHALALERMLLLMEEIERRGPRLTYVNIGGGYGISYDGREVSSAQDFAERLVPPLLSAGRKLIIEPGRFIVGNAGILVTRVVYVKRTTAGKTFVICDAAMNDLIRPTLYGAYHHIWPVQDEGSPLFGGPQERALSPVDVVGPVCESGDYLARDRAMPPVQEGDLLAVFGAGAYGMTMSSNYNSRPRAAEALADGRHLQLIRARERYDDLVRLEEVDGTLSHRRKEIQDE